MTEHIVPHILTIDQVASWLGRHPATVEKMVRAGKLPHVVLPTGDIVFIADELSTWIQSLPRQEANLPPNEVRPRRKP